MPQFGTGIIPASGAIASELSSVVRRAYMPRVYVQLWKSAPLIAALMSSAQVATGGLNPGDVAYPVGGITTRRNARYIRGDVVAIDQETLAVQLADGPPRGGCGVEAGPRASAWSSRPGCSSRLDRSSRRARSPLLSWADWLSLVSSCCEVRRLSLVSLSLASRSSLARTMDLGQR